MIDLGRHASGDGTKDGIGQTSRDTSGDIDGIAIGQTGRNVTAAGQHLQTIGTTNETDIIRIQSQIVAFANHQGGGGHGQTGAATRFQTHARTRASTFTKLAGLQTATTTKVSLTTLVIAPSGIGIHVVQGLVAHVNLRGTVTEHGAQTAGTGLVATPHGTERHVKGFATVKLTHFLAMATGFFIVIERSGREAQQTHDERRG